MTVARIIHGRWGPGIASVDDFKQEYVEHNPCRGIFAKIVEEKMQGYLVFIEMIADTKYHDRFREIHQKAADKVFACKQLSTTNRLMQEAYDAHKIII